MPEKHGRTVVFTCSSSLRAAVNWPVKHQTHGHSLPRVTILNLIVLPSRVSERALKIFEAILDHKLLWTIVVSRATANWPMKHQIHGHSLPRVDRDVLREWI